MALNGLLCADVPLRNCSLTHGSLLESIGTSQMNCAKMARDAIWTKFWTVAPTNHVLVQCAHWSHLANMIECSAATELRYRLTACRDMAAAPISLWAADAVECRNKFPHEKSASANAMPLQSAPAFVKILWLLVLVLLQQRNAQTRVVHWCSSTFNSSSINWRNWLISGQFTASVIWWR